jgi:TRAP-type C4-dicarboxylate transport system permease small subunit
MKRFLTSGGRVLSVVSGVLLAFGFQQRYGQYSSQLETLNHIPYGKLYVALLIIGAFMILRGNRMYP